MDVHIVDDDESMRELFTAFAEDMRFTALSFNSAESYIYHVCDNHNSLPKLVVLTDLEMSGMSGHELIAEIRKTRPDQKFIIATGNPDKFIHMEDKLCFYLTKPVRMQRIHSVFNALLQCRNIGPNTLCTNFDCGSLSDLVDFDVRDWQCPNKNK